MLRCIVLFALYIWFPLSVFLQQNIERLRKQITSHLPALQEKERPVFFILDQGQFFQALYRDFPQHS